MSDDTTTPQTETTPEVQGQEPKTFDASYVKELRDENAGLRISNREKVEAAKAEVAAEWEAKLSAKEAELAEVTSGFSSKELELAKLKIAMRSIDQESASRAEKLADLLKGDSEDSISASASSAKELFGGFKASAGPAVDPTQGSGSGVLPLNGDPLLAALKRTVGA